MEECLAIKPDLVFLWDEAWFGFARFSPLYRPRTAMGARAALTGGLRRPGLPASATSRRRRTLGSDLDPKDKRVLDDAAHPRSAQGQAARLPDQLDAQVDVGACARARWCWCGDEDYHHARAGVQGGGVHPRLDVAEPADHRLARRGAAADGARGLRAGHARDPARARDPSRGERAPADLEVLPRARRRRDDPGRVPPVRLHELPASRRHLGGRAAARSARTSSCLDPTRLTLVCGTAGFDGTQFKNLLASEYEIQLNKTSRNSILLQTNINNTRSDVANLLKVLVEISQGDRGAADERRRGERAGLRGAREVADGGRARPAQLQPLPRRVPRGPARARRSRATCAPAFYMAYDEAAASTSS